MTREDAALLVAISDPPRPRAAAEATGWSRPDWLRQKAPLSRQNATREGSLGRREMPECPAVSASVRCSPAGGQAPL